MKSLEYFVSVHSGFGWKVKRRVVNERNGTQTATALGY